MDDWRKKKAARQWATLLQWTARLHGSALQDAALDDRWLAYVVRGPGGRVTKAGRTELRVRQYWARPGVLPSPLWRTTGQVSVSVCAFPIRDRHKGHARWVAGLWADLDPPGDVPLDVWQDAVRERLYACVPEPTLIMFTGRGYQPLWLFEAPLDLDADPTGRWRQQVVRANQALQAQLGGDGVSDLSRVVRVPGSRNTRTGVPARLTYADGPRYAAHALLDQLSDPTAPVAELEPPPMAVTLPVVPTGPRRRGRPYLGVTLRDLRRLRPALRALVVGGVWAGGKRYRKWGGLDRSRADWVAVHAMVRAGWRDAQIVAAFTRVDWLIGVKFRELRDGGPRGPERAALYLGRTIAKVRAAQALPVDAGDAAPVYREQGR